MKNPFARPGNQNAVKPESDKPGSFLYAKVFGQEKASWVRAARRIGMNLTQWVRETLNERGEEIMIQKISCEQLEAYLAKPLEPDNARDYETEPAFKLGRLQAMFVRLWNDREFAKDLYSGIADIEKEKHAIEKEVA